MAFDDEVIDYVKNLNGLNKLMNCVNAGSVYELFGHRTMISAICFIDQFNNDNFERNKKIPFIDYNFKLNINNNITRDEIYESLKNIYVIIYDKILNCFENNIYKESDMRNFNKFFNVNLNIENKVLNEKSRNESIVKYASELNKHKFQIAYNNMKSLFSFLGKRHIIGSDNDEINNNLKYYRENKLLCDNLLLLFRTNGFHHNISTIKRRYYYLTSKDENITDYAFDIFPFTLSDAILELYTIYILVENKDGKNFKDSFNNGIISELIDYKKFSKKDLIYMFSCNELYYDVLKFVIKFLEENKETYKYDSRIIKKFRGVLLEITV